MKGENSMIDYDKSLINSFKATVINSKKNQLTDSDEKVLDALDKLGDFLSKYSELNDTEKMYLSQVIGKITFDVSKMTIIINGLNSK